MFSKKWPCYNEAAQKRPRRYKHDSKWTKYKSQQKDEIYPLTVKEIVAALKADAKLKLFFICNATLDKGLDLQIIEDENRICKKEGSLYQSRCNDMQ